MITTNVVNGAISGDKSIRSVEKGQSEESSKSKSSFNDTKNMFLQLLVAEMKYQDPLQPTDNTEYVKEMATFTQVESLQAVQSNVDELRAATMVGQYVDYLDEAGKVQTGKVEYTTRQSGETYLGIDGNLYALSEIQGVQDGTYYEAKVEAQTLENMIANLPAVNQLLLSDADKINSITTFMSSMSVTAQELVSEDSLTQLSLVVNRMQAMQEAAAASAAAKEDEPQDDGSGSAASGTEEAGTAEAEAAGTAEAAAQGAAAGSTENAGQSDHTEDTTGTDASDTAASGA